MEPRILITSGPTREYIDPVRYLSNSSSGRMGAALAEAVLKKGCVPIVITGPVGLNYPDKSEVHRVETTQEMLELSRRFFTDCVGVIGAAAPCDYRPIQVAPQKLKKSIQNNSETIIKLLETEDILMALGEMKTDLQWMVGFALETENGKTNALEKLHRKKCDFVVLNGPASLNSETADVVIYDNFGEIRATFNGTKSELAEKIITLALSLP
ncbi:MAG: phosphopantothenoylcysteine decarboxylase [Thermoguttaceae bacterium]